VGYCFSKIINNIYYNIHIYQYNRILKELEMTKDKNKIETLKKDLEITEKLLNMLDKM
jgi:hypothetical protein